MAKITIDIPDSKISKVTEAYSYRYGYEQTKLENETKAQFTKRMILTQIKELVHTTETEKAQRAAFEAQADLTDLSDIN